MLTIMVAINPDTTETDKDSLRRMVNDPNLELTGVSEITEQSHPDIWNLLQYSPSGK